jgi:peptide-methionine (R)-S-oxide reductase
MNAEPQRSRVKMERGKSWNKARLCLVLCALGVAAFTSLRCQMREETRPATTTTTATTNPVRSAAGYDVTPLDKAEIDRLAKSLTDEERSILLYAGTEAPFCGNLLANKKQGTYACRLCGLPLFESKTKFESGTGWPSFYQPVDRAHIAYIEDRSHGMLRVEIRCARCTGHLGHVFEDGPPPTGERYCLNSASMEFVEDGQPLPKKVASDVARK